MLIPQIERTSTSEYVRVPPANNLMIVELDLNHRMILLKGMSDLQRQAIYRVMDDINHHSVFDIQDVYVVRFHMTKDLADALEAFEYIKYIRGI